MYGDETKDTEEIIKQTHELFSTCSESIEGTDNMSSKTSFISKFCAKSNVDLLVGMGMYESISNVTIALQDLVHQQSDQEV